MNLLAFLAVLVAILDYSLVFLSMTYFFFVNCYFQFSIKSRKCVYIFGSLRLKRNTFFNSAIEMTKVIPNWNSIKFYEELSIFRKFSSTFHTICISYEIENETAKYFDFCKTSLPGGCHIPHLSFLPNS